MPEPFAYYDREADIAWIPTRTRPAAPPVSSTERPWGLTDRDSDGAVVGVEIWDASTRLPAPILSALPDAPSP